MKLESWAVRVLDEPRNGLAVLIGAAVGTPGASYLLALHNLVSSKTAATIATVAVFIFVTINFAPVIIPSAFVAVKPQGTEDSIKRFKDWIVSHDRQLAAAAALLAGGYMIISGTLRLLS